MMNMEWVEMRKKIRACPVESRYRLQPGLDLLIRDLKARGKSVPPEALQLNADLKDEAIEAQFDNLPV